MEIGAERFGAKWSASLAICVGEAYRLNGAEGTLPAEGWQRIRDAYLAAGGDPTTVETTPNQIIAVLCRMFPDWMHGPARRRLEREEKALAAERQVPKTF